MDVSSGELDVRRCHGFVFSARLRIAWWTGISTAATKLTCPARVSEFEVPEIDIVGWGTRSVW